MRNFKKAIIAAMTGASVIGLTAVNSFAATVDLPDVFSDLSPIIEIVLKIVEFISKIASFFA